jgi:ribosomal protein S18 acetylase RimI-like enzyme
MTDTVSPPGAALGGKVYQEMRKAMFDTLVRDTDAIKDVNAATILDAVKQRKASHQYNTWAQRMYAGPADRQAMETIIKARPATRATAFPTLGVLPVLLARPEIAANTHLWEGPQGHLAGFAIIDPSSAATWQRWFMWFDTTTTANADSIEEQIVAWSIQQVQTENRQRSAPLTLRISCRDNYPSRIALLNMSGFISQPERTLHLERSLHAPIPTPHLPPGYTLRHVQGEHEVEALAALHCAAFGAEFMTAERRLAMMRAPEYDPELDLVIEGPRGDLVAYCCCGVSAQENALTGRRMGYTDPIGVHPDYRGRGLARALLTDGFRQLKAHGMDWATLSTGNWNERMIDTAGSVGYRIAATTLFFETQG